jgi:1,2-phenylacetyl-CoA epoxidase catalytic subunit
MSWHDAAVRQQLKLLALETDKTEQKMMQEAINLVFAKYGEPQIA